MSVNKGKFDITGKILSFPAKKANFEFDINYLINKLDHIPGNYDAKIQLLLTIQQAYASKCRDDAEIEKAKKEENIDKPKISSTYEKNTILLNGNTGIGKSSLVKCVGELTSIPVVRFDLDNIVASSYVDPYAASASSDVLFLIHSMFYELHDKIAEKDMGTEDRIRHTEYKKTLTADGTSKEIILLREKPNAEFAIIEFDNSEALSQGDAVKGAVATILQSAITEVIRKPLSILPDGLTTKYFTYVFSSDLSKLLTLKNVGFRINKKQEINTDTLMYLGFSKGFTGVLTNTIDMKDLKTPDFERYLSRPESHLQQKLKNLTELYDMKVSLDKPAINLVAKYLENKGRNLKGIEEVTRIILAPHYISPQKGEKIVITSKNIHERLYKNK